MRVLYYALGGGHGHAMRGLAVLARLGSGTLVAPAAIAPWAATLGVEHLAPPGERVADWMRRLARPDLLLVDVFPRGVAGELGPVLGRAPAWLVSRRVRPDYYLHPQVRAAIETRYERLIWTEAPHESLRALRVPQRDAPPVLLGAPPLSRAEARQRLGVREDQRLVLGIGSGDPGQQARLCRLLGKIARRADAEMRFASAELPAGEHVVRAFPVAPLLRAADAVVSAAGYHAFHEAMAAGAPAVFVPQRRRFDDQAWRARGAMVATDPPGLEAAVRFLLRGGRREREPAGDGAALLARLVERRVEAGVVAEEQIAAPA